jgi:hypothetical protein
VIRTVRRAMALFATFAAAGLALAAPAHAGVTSNMAAATPAPASSAQVAALSCQEAVVTKIGLGPTGFSVRCAGNSASPYWAEGACARAGHQRGKTQFPPFVLPTYGPWSGIGCPSGDHLISFRSVHG